MKFQMNFKGIFLLIAILLLASMTLAGDITKPYTFSPDTPASSAQVNANFDALYQKINELSAKVATLESASAMNGVPIGTILAWHKSLSGNPSLDGGWVECNGQVLNDANSPYNGKTIPNLNGEARFLRGSSASGVLQDMDWKSFYIQSDQSEYSHGPLLVPKSGYTSPGIFGGKFEWAWNTLKFKFDDTSEVRPKNMSVVWVMRIK